MYSEIKPHLSYPSLQFLCLQLWLERTVLLFTFLVWFSHLPIFQIERLLLNAAIKGQKPGTKTACLGEYTQMLFCVKPHFVFLKCCIKAPHIIFPRDNSSCPSVGSVQFNVGYFSQEQLRHEHPEACYVNCLLGGWLHSAGFLVRGIWGSLSLCE